MSRSQLFIEQANKKHNNKYDYSLVEYKNNNTKVKIICPIHGVFEQTPHNHAYGYGCKECGYNIAGEKTKISKEVFVEMANKIHNNKYDYSLVEYKNCKSKIKIICPIHGVFEQIPQVHYNGQGCPSCGIISRANKRRKSLEDFVKQANEIHNYEYDYSFVEYKGKKERIILVHRICGTKFYQKPDLHINQMCGCPKCCASHGEKKIRKILIENNILFMEQFRIKECRNKFPLPFDFAIFKEDVLSCLIEYNGEQHYKSVNHFGGDKKFARQINNDKLKMEYCHKNNIPFLVIRFDEDYKSVLCDFIKKYS